MLPEPTRGKEFGVSERFRGFGERWRDKGRVAIRPAFCYIFFSEAKRDSLDAVMQA
jgi:hypothetical protein